MYNYLINLTSDEGKYLLYLIDRISELEKNFNNLLKDRDFRLNLVINDEYESFKLELENNLNVIKNSIDKLDLKNLNRKELENIASYIDILSTYFSSTIVLLSTDYSNTKK
jgi:DNA polymerase III delta subunit